MIRNNLNSFFSILLVICWGCVPLHQQISESEDLEIEGYVGPLIIDEEEFSRQASLGIYDRMTVDDQFLPANSNVTYEDTFSGRRVYMRNCKCLKDANIIQDKLIVVHSYGGGESNRESTKLLWNGKYYQNSKGEYIVELILFSDKIDMRRALLREKKILDVKAVQLEGVSFVWINLVGYDRLIRYPY